MNIPKHYDEKLLTMNPPIRMWIWISPYHCLHDKSKCKVRSVGDAKFLTLFLDFTIVKIWFVEQNKGGFFLLYFMLQLLLLVGI